MIGREAELALLQEFLVTEARAPAFVLTGSPGIGKTTLWEAGIGLARHRGLRVLSARPNEAEADLSFASLADLCDDVDTTTLTDVPPPQRRALEIALLRADPGGAPPESFAISAGFTNSVRTLSTQEPLVIAIDDVQWLDRPSADVLVFAARRLRGYSVHFLLARRPGDPSALEQALEPLGIERHGIGPLSFGAARAMLLARLRQPLPRPILRRVFEASEGNPLFMLELGRTLVERGLPDSGADLPLPRVVDDLFGTRIAGASRSVRKLVLAIALAGTLTRSQLVSIGDEDALDDAVEAGLLVAERERVRVSHPLLAAAATASATPRERRGLHADLARAVTDETLRARHLALATTLPDEQLAAEIAAAAARAMARGAAQDAVDLAQHALRLTPPDAAEHVDRTLTLGEYLDVVGDKPRIEELLGFRLAEIPPGETRARAHLLLAATAEGIGHEAQLERALAESTHHPVMRAVVQEKRATLFAGIRVERFHDAERWLHDALPPDGLGQDDVEGNVLHTLAWIGMLRGHSIEEPVRRLEQLALSAIQRSNIDHLVMQELVFRGEVTRARPLFRNLLALSDDRGEARYGRVHFQLCGLELRAGETNAASNLLSEADEWAGYSRTNIGLARFRAVLAAIRGVPGATEELATAAIDASDTAGYVWGRLDGLRARGIAALVSGELAHAAECLRAVWDHTLREGIDNPGVFPVAPDLVEALAELGELDEANAVTSRLRELAEQQQHPWGLPTASRSEALIQLAEGQADGSLAQLEDAAVAYSELGLRFDLARTLLELGRAERRLKKWGAARGSLERAAAAFDETGSNGWAEHARTELARVSARRPQAAGGLTPSEERVIQLAVDGLSNKEIAQTLFISVYTVEAHLKHAYAKLGVRSRTQLHRRLSET